MKMNPCHKAFFGALFLLLTNLYFSVAQQTNGIGEIPTGSRWAYNSTLSPGIGNRSVDTSSFKLPDLNSLRAATVQKGNIPKVKFLANDPCNASNKVTTGVPWETSASKPDITRLAGVEAVIPPPIPDLDKLSNFNYNAAVSLAFEGMRLVYGDMPDEEARKFEAIWSPLFDFPTQDIIDYLNQLNPLISQFLAAREVYVSNLNAITMILLDAGYAVELDDQDAWEKIMNEAGLYGSAFPILEKAMLVLAERIEALGNPPSPIDAKCAAAENYKRMLPQKEKAGDMGELWAGYTKSPIQAEGFEQLYEPLFRHLLKVKVEGKEVYQIIELGDIETNELGSEYEWLDKVRVHQVDEVVDDEDKSMSTRDGDFKRFSYPRIPEFKQTSYLRLLMLAEQSSPGNEDEDNYDERKTFSNTSKRFLARKQTAGFFYKRAILWGLGNKWQNYPLEQNGMISDEALEAFVAEMRAEMKAYLDAEALRGKERKRAIAELDKANAIPGPEENTEKARLDSLAAQRQAIDESIACRNEIIESINSQIIREQSIRSRLSTDLFNAQDDATRKRIMREMADVDSRIMGFQSTMQNERDAVKTMQTGETVHTRQVFDDFARNKFIYDTHVHVAKVNATRRIADRIYRQINLLPEEQRDKARDMADKYLDAKAVVSGDYENALKLRNAFNNQIQGNAEFDFQQARIAESEADENEFIAQASIMATGAAFMGVGSAGLAQVYGAEAAATIYGTQALGALFGGATGMIAGGPYEGIKQAAMFWSPNGAAIAEFTDAYIQAGKQKGATTKTQIFEGIKQAGTGYLVGMGMQWGVQKFTSATMAIFGSNNRLFKPIINTKAMVQSSVDKIRTRRGTQDAIETINTLKGMKNELNSLRNAPTRDVARIEKLEGEISQLVAGYNADYHTKWQFKYKQDPEISGFFDRYVQKNYQKMTPDMVKSLESKGYVMDHITFKQFRNATSAGSSSMDLDLVPINKFTGEEPLFMLKKDGSQVGIDVFMRDNAASMNEVYRKLFGISAKLSDMNLVTSAHPEAFSTTKLLDKNVDFNMLTPQEIASVGKVLKVKIKGIEDNNLYTNTTKLQAKCREASKEIDNMLLKKLDAELRMAPAGSFESKQIQARKQYWTEVNTKIKQIGTQETDPMIISQVNKEISMQTGGKDALAVINDLNNAFGR